MFRLPLLCLLFGLLATLGRASPRVAVITDAPWSPADAARDGAAEFKVLLQLAQLQRHDPSVGLVGVGNRRGVFQQGTQRALEFAARQGVPVVRIARGVNAEPIEGSDLFIDGGVLSAEAATALLTECLTRYGALPSLPLQKPADARTRQAFRAKLALYQAHFTARQPLTVAIR